MLSAAHRTGQLGRGALTGRRDSEKVLAELAASHSHGQHDAIESTGEHAPAELTGAVGGGQHLVDPQDETAPVGRNR